MTPEHDQRSMLAYHQEAGEVLNPHAGAFLGGMFEISGNMTLESGFLNKTLAGGQVVEYFYTRPVVSYNDTRSGKIERLIEVFGGASLKDNKSNSFMWFVKSKKAVELATQMSPYAPSRTRMITAFQEWLNSDDMAEKLQIADVARRGATQTNAGMTQDNYSALVRNPEFMAGVVDARGALDIREGNPRYLIITSMNGALLEAIKAAYSGGITEATPKSKALAISRHPAASLMSKVAPHLLNY